MISSTVSDPCVGVLTNRQKIDRKKIPHRATDSHHGKKEMIFRVVTLFEVNSVCWVWCVAAAVCEILGQRGLSSVVGTELALIPGKQRFYVKELWQ